MVHDIKLTFPSPLISVRSRIIDPNGKWTEPRPSMTRSLDRRGWDDLVSFQDKITHRVDHKDVEIVLLLHVGAAPIVVTTYAEAMEIAAQVWVPLARQPEKKLSDLIAQEVSITWSPDGLQITPTHVVGS